MNSIVCIKKSSYKTDYGKNLFSSIVSGTIENLEPYKPSTFKFSNLLVADILTALKDLKKRKDIIGDDKYCKNYKWFMKIAIYYYGRKKI